MSDLISREDLKKAIHNFFDGKVIDEPAYILRDVFCYIDGAPTVEVIPNEEMYEMYGKGYLQGYERGKNERSEGEWIDEGQYAEGHSEHAYLCKRCGYQIIELPNMIFENRFCKYCGAEMRKGGAV